MIALIKSILLVLAFGAFTALSFSQSASAVAVSPLCNPGSVAASTDVCRSVNSKSDGSSPIISTLKDAINLISIIIGVAAVIIIILAGLRFMLSGGDPQSISGARDAIIYAGVGIIIAVAAQAIVVFVLDNLS